MPRPRAESPRGFGGGRDRLGARGAAGGRCAPDGPLRRWAQPRRDSQDHHWLDAVRGPACGVRSTISDPVRYSALSSRLARSTPMPGQPDMSRRLAAPARRRSIAGPSAPLRRASLRVGACSEPVARVGRDLVEQRLARALDRQRPQQRRQGAVVRRVADALMLVMAGRAQSRALGGEQPKPRQRGRGRVVVDRARRVVQRLRGKQRDRPDQPPAAQVQEGRLAVAHTGGGDGHHVLPAIRERTQPPQVGQQRRRQQRRGDRAVRALALEIADPPEPVVPPVHAAMVGGSGDEVVTNCMFGRDRTAGPPDRNRTCICRLGGGRSIH